ncbi:hypothetical protein [Streptomyces bohaiensis]|uniref:hypothetical protein n=1 Tax=Streptomyces bohaiensis TaxID=1431344 RepID=UPI003B800AE6
MRRSRALAVMVRVLFATVPVWSLGLLGWVPALRIAIVRRRPVDRAFAAAAVVLTIAYVAVIGSTPEETGDWSVAQNAAFGLLLLALVPGAVVHACVADLPLPPSRGHHPQAVPAGYGYPAPGHHPYPGQAYGAPGPAPAAPGGWAPPHGYGGWGTAPTPSYAPPAAAPAYHRPAAPHPSGTHGPTPGAPPTAEPGPAGAAPPAHTPPPAATPPPDGPASDGPDPASSSRLRQAASELDELGDLLRERDDRR